MLEGDIKGYCDANKLSMREQLGLFIQVCLAVQHAHQKGIIHRDLKPSNILVTEVDGAPVPKVIDFGVAKATQVRLTEMTLFTGLHQMIGTPTYMSPEQAGLGALDMDTRSDIYALGVLLYELLTGQTPITKEDFEKAGIDEILRLSLPCPLPAFACLDFPSPVSRPRLCRKTSGSAAVARFAPCSSGLPVLPLRYVLAAS